MSTQKKSRGRQKIEMKKMTNESNLQVTFSKRRSGLFKKASELCTLCGASVALVVFSPGEKVFSFGHPNVDAVIDRYLTRGPPADLATMHQYIDAHRIANVRDLNAQLTRINAQIDAERKRGEELNLMRMEAQVYMWWAGSLDGMTMEQLKQYKAGLEELKQHVARLADRALYQSVLNTNPGHQFFSGSSSSSTSNAVLQPQPLPLPAPAFPPQMMQPAPMMQNYMFPDGSMMNPYGFNDMGMGGGYGPAPGPGPGPGPSGGFF